MARRYASELAQRLGRQAEAVCRHYLSAGYREGRYWLVGDVRNTPGRSMFVRLKGADSGRGAAGKWTEHVALRVMLRLRVVVLIRGTFRRTAQHNVRTRRGIR